MSIIEHNMKSLISEIIDKMDIKSNAKTQMQEEETYEYDGLTYMERKIKKIQKSSMRYFDSSLSGMKKSYSRIQREQLELKKQRAEKEDSNNTNENYVVYKKDDKAIVSQANQENNENDISFLNKKRGNAKKLVAIHGYTPIKKSKPNNIIEEYNDFGTMMSKAIKAKPKIQINKENYIEELKKQKEEELNKNKADSTHKELKQVIKLE